MVVGWVGVRFDCFIIIIILYMLYFPATVVHYQKQIIVLSCTVHKTT